jgi:hypothetical protein
MDTLTLDPSKMIKDRGFFLNGYGKLCVGSKGGVPVSAWVLKLTPRVGSTYLGAFTWVYKSTYQGVFTVHNVANGRF